MESFNQTRFNIHFVTVYDEDEDTTTSYYELLEESGHSHGLFNSCADAEVALRSIQPDSSKVHITLSAEITIAGSNLCEQRSIF